MERLLVAVALVAVVAVVALVVERRRARSDAPTQPKVWPVPGQLDRADFPDAERPWLVAVFTSATCESCARVVRMTEPLRSPEVGVAHLAWQDHRDLHERYGIEAVPCVAVADADGVVRVGFVGSTITATDLWAAVAEAREPGSSPEPHLGRPEGP